MIEKSPVYAERFPRTAKRKSERVRKQTLTDLKEGNYETVKRAKQMKQENPNLKLFIFITDPVGRSRIDNYSKRLDYAAHNMLTYSVNLLKSVFTNKANFSACYG